MGIAVQHGPILKESRGFFLGCVSGLACELGQLLSPNCLQSGDPAKFKLFCWHRMETPTSWGRGGGEQGTACDSAVDQVLGVSLKSVTWCQELTCLKNFLLALIFCISYEFLGRCIHNVRAESENAVGLSLIVR